MSIASVFIQLNLRVPELPVGIRAPDPHTYYSSIPQIRQEVG